MVHEENKIFHNSDQAQVFITFSEKVVTIIRMSSLDESFFLKWSVQASRHPPPEMLSFTDSSISKR